MIVVAGWIFLCEFWLWVICWCWRNSRQGLVLGQRSRVLFFPHILSSVLKLAWPTHIKCVGCRYWCQIQICIQLVSVECTVLTLLDNMLHYAGDVDGWCRLLIMFSILWIKHWQNGHYCFNMSSICLEVQWWNDTNYWYHGYTYHWGHGKTLTLIPMQAKHLIWNIWMVTIAMILTKNHDYKIDFLVELIVVTDNDNNPQPDLY